MLKKRIVGVVIVRDGVAVQSLGFRRYLPIGRPEVVVEYLDIWGIDEIAVVDISAGRSGKINLGLIKKVSAFCRVPLTYAGGIRSTEDMTAVIKAGADKLMINSAFRENPSLVTEGAERLGNQCIIVSLDVLRNESADAFVYDYSKNGASSLTPLVAVAKAEELGAGEIFLNSVNRDGAKQGFDLALARDVAGKINIPLTICGGVGHASHFAAGLEIENVSAVAAGNYFNFTEHSVTTTKSFILRSANGLLRQDTSFPYAETSFLDTGRLAKRPDAVLKEMLFEFHPKEII